MRSISLYAVLLVSTIGLAASPPDFDGVVAPLLVKRCLGCHSGGDPKGDLDLTKKANAPLTPGKPSESALWKRVETDDMPPKNPLSADEKAVLKSWIEGGAKWGTDPIRVRADPKEWWSFQPIQKPVVPKHQSAIDYFLAKEHKAKGLIPTPLADNRTLIRRLYFDLIGLPPTPEQIRAFEQNEKPDAYEKLVEELLASPQYGERWARHWLDVVHFGETHGYDKDQPRPNAWPYRDYVIRAFNADTPYAKFVQEQIAGDVLFPGTVDGIEALGFLSAGPWDFIGHAELPESKLDGKVARHLDRDDFVANTMSTFLSLTAHCAQCHDHKFDPIAQKEYYGLQAIFAAIDRTDRTYDTDPIILAKRGELEAKRKALETKRIELDLAKRIATLAVLAAIRKELQELPKSSRTAFIGGIHTGMGNFVGTGANGGKPRPIHLLNRGEITKPGAEVGPSAISALPMKFELPPNASDCERRAALAKWLTHKDNPLIWRSIVNRVWQYHFGRGLVDTPNDFGRMGQLPTHPELLDYLAIEFRDGGGSLKALHKKILMSEAYRRSSASIASNQKLDSDNRFLWRQNRRKLEAEAVRDSMLFVAGKLDLKMGGPSFQDFVVEKPEHSPHYRYDLHDPEDAKSHRRAIYRFAVRSQPQPFLAALDCADPNLSVEKRNQSISPQQALALLNNKLGLAMAKHFASRLGKLATNESGRVKLAFQLALGREPTASELEVLVKHAKEFGLPSACRVILNLNEFAFVD